jgi:succinoglycan biosynthesis transport protein ExoP
MTPSQTLQLLWARRRLLTWTLGGIVAAVAALSLLLPKTYVAEVSVVVDSKSTDPVSGVEQAAELLPSNVATQADVIASRNVALKVTDKLHLISSPELQESFREAGGGIGSIRDWVADLLLKNIEVKPSRESHVINVDVAFGDPVVAAQIANAFADAYIQTSLELKTEPARRQSAWFQEQLQTLRRSVEAAQARLSDYQRGHAVVGTNDQIDIENGRLAEISNQLLTAQAAQYETDARLSQLRQALQQDRLYAVPDLLSNPLLQGMKADLARAEGKLADTAQHFGKNHPAYLSSAAEVGVLHDKLAAEAQTAAGAIEQSAQQSVRQVTELRRALDQQRDRILQLKRQHDDLDVLKREVDNAQHMYDAGLQRATQVRLEGQLDESNIAILNAAVPPMRAARPRVLLNILVAVVAGGMLAVALVLALERSDPRVRTVLDLQAGLAVLAEVPRSPRKPRRRDALASAPGALAVKAH